MIEPIQVEGLTQFNRALKKLDSDAPKGLRVALNAAADVVVQAARQRVPKRTGRAAASIKPRSTRTAVRIAAGGNRAPYYPWLDFGGGVGRNKSIQRPFLKEGRYIYKVYAEKKQSGEFQRALEKALAGVVEQAGLEVT